MLLRLNNFLTKLGRITSIDVVMYRQDKSFMRDPATVNSRIYVGNLDESVTSDSLKEHFQAHGNILGVVVQRGFGFIQFEEDSSAQQSIQKEHGAMFQGRKLNVKQAIDNKNKNAPPGAPMENLPTPGPGKPIGPPKPMDGGPPRKMMRRGGGPPRGGGRGGGVIGMERDISPGGAGGEDRDYSYCRDGPSYYDREYPGPGGGYVPPPVPDRPHRPNDRNDCEIIVVAKALTEYAEYIEHRLKSIGLVVDLLFPNEDVPIGRVLANISSRGCLYAILVMPQNEEHRSLTLNILHGIPQEHRNMPVDDAVALISRNFDAYMRGEKSGGPSNVSIAPAPPSAERHPEAIQILLNLLADNRQLTTLQYDRIIKYLQERRELQYKQEIGESLNEKDFKKETELQNRIMSILNKTGASPGAPSPVMVPSVPPPAAKTSTPILNDPSVQKALDSLLQGDILKSISSTGRF